VGTLSIRRSILALVSLVVLAFPVSVAAEPGSRVNLTGLLAAIIDDTPASTHAPDSYALETADGHVQLAISGDVRAKVGARVSLSGIEMPDGRVAVAAADILVTAPPAEISPALIRPALDSTDGPVSSAVVQTRKIAVIIASYTDLTAPVTAAQATAAFSTATSSVKQYFEASSRGLVTTTTTVYGTWSLGISQCTGGAAAIFDRSQTAVYAYASAHGVNLGAYDHVVLWTQTPCGVGWIGRGYLPGSYVQILDYAKYGTEPAFSALVAAHEIGHNLGLRHSQGLGCFDGGGTEIVIGTSCEYAEYADMYTTMGAAGSPAHTLMDSERLSYLGWLAPSESQAVHAAGNYTIVPTYSGLAGVRLLQIDAPNPVDTGLPGHWSVELRSSLAGSFETYSSYTLPAVTGVSIRYVEETYLSGQSYMLDVDPTGGYLAGVHNLNVSGDWYWDAPLQPGETFTDPYGGITIRLNSVTGSGASVTIGDTAAPSAPPTFTATPLAGGGARLDWTAGSDNLGVAKYRLYRDGSQIGEVSSSSLTYTDPPTLGVGGLHTFSVKSVDSAGLLSGATSASATLTSVPSAPTGVAGTPGNSAVLVTWVAPPNGGSPITGYTVTSAPGGFTCSAATTAGCVVSGLTNGLSYTFSVTATNAIGTGPASSDSAGIVPLNVPGRATAVGGVPGNASVIVSWTAPSDLGGGTFSGYTVTAAPGGATCTSPLTTSCTVSGLSNGSTYRFTVVATNSIGAGLASDPSAQITPRRAPDAPTGIAAVASNAQATVSWLAPGFNGGAAITSYTVTSAPGGKTCTTSGLSCVVGGLTNRTSYQFSVRASNVAGQGSVSALSTAAMPLFGATYFPVIPNRLVDSRAGASRTGLSASLLSGTPVSFQVTGRVPADATKNIPANATAVTGNLTVVNQGWRGYFSLTPTAPVGIPGTSTLNFPIGDIRANAVTVPLGPGGVLWVTYTGAAGKRADVVFDVTGYFVPNTTGATYRTVTPNRLVDSRAGPQQQGLSASLLSGAPVSFQVTGRVPGDSTMNVPSAAVAVTGNLTAVNEGSKGYLSLTPAKPSGIPSTSTINFPARDIRANAVTVRLGTGGVLWVTFTGTSGTSADAVFDVTGYFLPDATGATYVPVTPNRLVDSRPGAFQEGLSASLLSGTPASFAVTGLSPDVALNIPADAVGVTGNLTAVNEASRGYFTLTPAAPVGIPSTSTLNFPIGDIRANAVSVPLGEGGILWLTFTGTSGAHADAVFDVTGYYTLN
jgi:hypothetical protein